MSDSCNFGIEDIPKRPQANLPPEEWVQNALEVFWSEFNKSSGFPDDCFIPGFKEGELPGKSGQSYQDQSSQIDSQNGGDGGSPLTNQNQPTGDQNSTSNNPNQDSEVPSTEGN